MTASLPLPNPLSLLQSFTFYRPAYLALRRRLPCSARSLTLVLLLLFVTLNLLVYTSFHPRFLFSSSAFDPPDLPIDRRESSGLMQSDQHPFAQTSDWTVEWFRQLYLDPALNETVGQDLIMDVVYTWVNGSDPLLRSLKEGYQDRSPFFQAFQRQRDESSKSKSNDDLTANRFRDMSELKYSVRSVSQYFSKAIFNRIHILTTAVDEKQVEIQVPSWLDLEASADRVRLVPHEMIFGNKSDLPSFNSLAIESQIHHIPSVTDVFLYLNDDVFLGTEMVAADIWTPLYGFVFHMEPTLLVPPTLLPLPENSLAVGEWHSLQFSNNLLSRQFGPRPRSYLAHVPHVLCVPMLQEIQTLWSKEFAQTSSHRFRGDGQALDIHVSFFMAHYVIERLRETQLSSFWNYRLDANLDGTLSWAERHLLIERIRRWNQAQQYLAESLTDPVESAYLPVSGFNNSLTDHELKLQRLGYPRSGSSDYKLSGLDGFPFMLQSTVQDFTKTPGKTGAATPYLPHFPVERRTCHLDIDYCLGPQFTDENITVLDKAASTQIFEDLAFAKFRCGDCLLHMLRQSSKLPGLGSEILPLNTKSTAFREVAEDLAKYNYVIATSPYSFIGLTEPQDATNKLNHIKNRQYIEAFFCINDNAGDNPKVVDQIRQIFADFLEARFPIPSPWEK
ncbi:Xanthine phosphoribosyltransferase 1 [Mortierella sp. GBA35]|nr:Xanthine phosphoribosyltransferase 1 [Mortierella sp. GBA35]